MKQHKHCNTNSANIPTFNVVSLFNRPKCVTLVKISLVQPDLGVSSLFYKNL